MEQILVLSGFHLRTFTHKSTRCQKNNGMTLFHAATRSRITFALALKFAIQKVVSMPIRVTCQCGHNLSVPDSMAGKSGKCPKCQQIIKVPVAVTPAKSGQSAPSSPTTAKAGTPAAPAKTTGAPANAKGTQASADAPAIAPAGLGGLLDAAGLTQRTGRFCPACDAPAANTAVICVKCGLNFTEGTKLEGFQSTEKKRFGNKRLNEAADMMSRELETEKRLLNTGSPWCSRQNGCNDERKEVDYRRYRTHSAGRLVECNEFFCWNGVRFDCFLCLPCNSFHRFLRIGKARLALLFRSLLCNLLHVFKDIIEATVWNCYDFLGDSDPCYLFAWLLVTENIISTQITDSNPSP